MTTALTDNAAATLAAARRHRAEADAAEVALLLDTVEWAAMHEVGSDDYYATWGDTPLPIAGEGAPLIGEFCIAELAAAIGVKTESGRYLLAHAVEIAHRLPRLYARVQAGELQAWRARRIAEKTLSLSPEAAAYVDRQAAPFAHRIGPVQTDRLVDEAIARFMPETAQEIANRAADGRGITVDHRQVSYAGTSKVYGELDLADALDLDAALIRGAEALKAWGSEDSLEVRRAAALGFLARGEAFLEPTTSPRGTRDVTLYVHLSPDDATGRLENAGQQLVTRDQISDWLSVPGSRVSVRPVIDLAEQITSASYQPSPRLREQVTLRDGTCAFPWCTKPARRCDKDHLESFDPDQPAEDQTTSDGLGSLCRTHHRLKTFGGWSYTTLEPGVYLWRSPHGLGYLRDRHGTQCLTPRPVDPPG